jgi:hypothetical protein
LSCCRDWGRRWQRRTRKPDDAARLRTREDQFPWWWPVAGASGAPVPSARSNSAAKAQSLDRARCDVHRRKGVGGGSVQASVQVVRDKGALSTPNHGGCATAAWRDADVPTNRHANQHKARSHNDPPIPLLSHATDRQTDQPTDRQIDRQTDSHSER